MKNEDNTISYRYYIFRHQPANQVTETVMYRTSTGSWTADFDKAGLWADHSFATKKAAALKKQLYTVHSTWNVVIGKVKIEACGMFVLELL